MHNIRIFFKVHMNLLLPSARTFQVLKHHYQTFAVSGFYEI